MMRPKSNPERDEKYLRAVASLPCIRCGVHGYSQAAHGPTLGRGIKCSDRHTFPLCCARPGLIGCHAAYDSYEGYTSEQRAKMANIWAQRTREALEVAA